MAERPSLPEGLQDALKDVRTGMNLRWNPKAVLVKAGSFDADGKLGKDPIYEPRWELWDVDTYNNDYKIMTVRTPEGGFRQPGFWLVELINSLNPAHYGGDVSKMMRHLVDDCNDSITTIAENDLDDLIDQAAKWHWYAAMPKVSYAGMNVPR